VKQANVTSRELGRKDIKDNNEKGNTTPHDSPKTQHRIIMTSRSQRTKICQGHNEQEKREKPKNHKTQDSKEREIRNK
jgi:hypothetical protein